MILLDVNLLLYAKFSDYPNHPRAHAWLDQQLNAPHPVGLPWPTVFGFLRISTHPRVYAKPLSSDDARLQVAAWMSCPTVWSPAPTERHWGVFDALARTSQATGALVPDAHLAALAIEHGLTLCSTDGDFARFDGLRWLNPLGA